MQQKCEIKDPGSPYGDLSPEEFRKYGHQLIDWIADYLECPEKYPVVSKLTPGSIKELLPVEPPKKPEPMDEIIKDMENIIVPGLTHWNHPLFMAYFSITGSIPGILGELLCAAFNVNAMLWKTSPAATELEEVTMDWLRQLLGLPDSFEGIIYDTASVSTMHGIAAARESAGLDIREKGMAGRKDIPRLRLYCSEEAHSSVEKGAITLGIGQEGVRKIPTNEKFQMSTEELEKAIAEDIGHGWKPFCVVATIGTTSSTSIDPIPGIADICKKYDIWLHIDAAYGGSAALLSEMRCLFKGWERADSIVMNPHKWLFTPIDCSAFFCRHFDVLKRAFSLVPEYLKTSEDSKVRNYMDYGVQLGRRFRSLKLWMVLRSYGKIGLKKNIRSHIKMAQDLASWIKEEKNFEIMAPTPFSTVCFRLNPSTDEKKLSEEELEELNSRLMNSVNDSGKAFISHTKLKGKYTLRIALGNIRTTSGHVSALWQTIKNEGEKVTGA